MDDILILFGKCMNAESGRVMLAKRPGMRDHELSEYTHPWGCVIVQHAKATGNVSFVDDDRVIIPIGRPIVRDQDLGSNPNSIAQWVSKHDADCLVDNAGVINASLSGMYAIFEICADRVSVLTDHMGFRPVYVSLNQDGQLLGIGTHLESLAVATGQLDQIDLVSIGELFTHNYITFPFTTRTTIRELDPCSITKIDPSTNAIQTKILWEPSEPANFPTEAETRSALRSAMLSAGDDLSRNCSRVGVLLSGGFDSRAVLSVIPKDRVRSALTYVTRQNRETRVAGEVAHAAGTTQVLVQRDDDYFPMLVERGLDLIGMELRGNCHGLCIADNGLTEDYDVIIGGQLSDTLLKDHFMPMDKRQQLRPQTIRSKIRALVKGPVPKSPLNPHHTTGRELLESELTDEIREQVRQRKETRMREVERVRPTTADEWHRFWPCSRQDDSSHTLGNARLMCADTLFAHQAIVEVAQKFDPKFRIDGALTDSVFVELGGTLTDIINANTGLPASASKKTIHTHWKKNRKNAESISQVQSSDWNDVQTSWVNPITMQTQSPFWIEKRSELASSAAIETLSLVIKRGGKIMVGSYQEDLPSTSNHIAMQLAIWMDRLTNINDFKVREAVQ